MRDGDRVYDKAINANGYVLHCSLAGATVQYFWGMHSKYDMNWPERTRAQWHTETPDKQRLVTNLNDLVVTPFPATKRNKVGMFGRRILNTRIGLIAEIPRWKYGNPDVDILIRYGVRPYGSHVQGDTLILNHNLTINKWDQCVKLRGLVPDVLARPEDGMDTPDDKWIVKPHFSVGGKGIEDWNGTNHHGKYLQRRINKAREFRAHGFLWAKDKVPLIQEKTICDRSQLCWNMKKGGSFHYCYQPTRGVDKLGPELVERIKNITIDALKKLKYDMGGVDLVMDDNGELFILEVNSYWGQREMTLASTKQSFYELWNLDINDYKATRWQPRYRPIIDQTAINMANLELEAASIQSLKGCAEHYKSFNLADREVSIG